MVEAVLLIALFFPSFIFAMVGLFEILFGKEERERVLLWAGRESLSSSIFGARQHKVHGVYPLNENMPTVHCLASQI